jgi:hypothetical protein
MICPLCNGQLESVIEATGMRPQYCPHCDKIWVGDDETIQNESLSTKGKQEVEIPKLAVETVVYVTNREHDFFLEIGVIIKKDHKHYRVQFNSQNPKINKKLLWMPEHWIAAMPQEMVR